jgi:phage shock protein PspC (stress-responsive transcriptional regulator)
MNQKKLYRSCKDQILGGVAAGIAEYFDVDSTLIRLLWALSFFAGFGIPAYIVAWIIIPLDPSCKSHKTGADEIKDKAEQIATDIRNAVHDDVSNKKNVRHDDLRFWFGLIVIFFAASLLIQGFFGFNFWHNFWPIVFVALGIILIATSMERR